jgi:hypothetical protein
VGGVDEDAIFVNFQMNSCDVLVVGCLACGVGLTMTREAAVSIGGTEREFCISAAEANPKRFSGDFFSENNRSITIPHHQP